MTNRLLHASADVRAVAGDARSFDVIASSEALDSHGTVIDQNSWDLSRFATNAPVLWSHESRELPVGVAKDVRVESGRLRARVTLVSAEANPRAEQIRMLMAEGALRGISVGFMTGNATREKRGGRDVTVLRQNQLVEISIVNTPSNPETLAQLRSLATEGAAHEEPMANAKKTVDADEEVIKNAPAQPEAVRAPAAPADALAIKCQTFEVECARLGAVVDGLESKLLAREREIAELRANDAGDQLVAAHAHIDALEARLVAQERAALLADGRASGKLSPAHLDASTKKGAYVAQLSVHGLRAFIEQKEREVPLVDARPPRPIRAKDWDEMAPSDKARLYTNDRATYDALKAAAGQ